jgi:hypothetical protein
VKNNILATTADPSATAIARCTYTHKTYYRTLETDAWSESLPSPNYVATSPARDTTTLEFSVSITTGIATAGDNIASRFVRRVH